MPKSIKVTGTGLSGLVGSRVVELLSLQYSFKNLDLATGVDITRKELVKKAIGESRGDAVIHLAAFTNVDEAFTQANDKTNLCYRLNVKATRYVAQYCKEYGKYLIHISTDFVFDGENPPAGGYRETDPPNPLEWYGKTKAWAEAEVAKAGGRYAIVRIAYPFRARHELKQDLVRSLLSKFADKSLYPMFTDQIITPTFIDDIAQGLAIFLQKQPQGIYHLVGSTPLSPYQIAREVAQVFDFDSSLVKKGSLKEYLKTAKRPYQKQLIVSNRKVKAELGIKMKTFREALLEIKKQLN